MLDRTKMASVALGETFRMALDTLRSHKLRSFLTLLGIILAVLTLVAVMSVVEGLNLYISDKIANLGANAFVIDRFGIITSFEAFIRAQKRPVLSEGDYQFLGQRMQLATAVAATTGTSQDVRYGNDLLEDVRIQGATPNYAEVRSIGVSIGRALTEADDTHRAPVCVIGADVARRFFSASDPIGKTLRAGSQVYEVVGVADAIGSVFGISQDNFLIIPFHTYEKTWHTPSESILIFVQAASPELMDQAQDEARMLLRAKHHQAYDDPDNFGIIAPSSITGLWEQLTGNIFALAVWLTSVFMVVGGIVIMNIMLASVTERTREIGLRRSLGARRKHIVLQFVTESAVLAATGGFFGICLAYALVAVARAATSIPMRTPISAVILSLGVSTAVGLFFGIYPAMRAAKLDPIEALRADG
jgi:putative ABC transport system permease protein